MRTKRIQITRLTTEDGYDVWNKMIENHIIPTLVAFDNVELVSNNKIKTHNDVEKVDQPLFKVNGMEGPLLFMHINSNSSGNITSCHYGLSNGLNLPVKTSVGMTPQPYLVVASIDIDNLDVTMITFSRNNKLYAVGFKITNSNIANFVVFTTTKSGTKYAMVLRDDHKLYIDGGTGSTLATVGDIGDFDLPFTAENKVLMMPAMSRKNNILDEELPELFLISNNSFKGINDNQQIIINGEKYRKTGSRGTISQRILFLSEGEE